MLCGYQDVPQHLRQLLRRAGRCLFGVFPGSPFPCTSAWPSCTQVKTHPREEDEASASPRTAEPWVSVSYLGRATAESVTANRSRAAAGYPQARGQQLPNSHETSTGKKLGRQLCPSSPCPESVPKEHPQLVIRSHSKQRLPTQACSAALRASTSAAKNKIKKTIKK